MTKEGEPPAPRDAARKCAADNVGVIPNHATFADTRTDLTAFLGGDEEGFARLWERFRPGLYVLIAGRVRERLSTSLRTRLDAEIEDILHDTARTVLLKLGDFEYRGPGSLLAWMGRIADRAVRDRIDYWNAERRRPDRERRISESTANSAGDVQPAEPMPANRSPGPRTLAVLNEARRKVAAALATLSDRRHTIVHLRYFAGATWDEIADILGDSSTDAIQREFRELILTDLRKLID